MRTIGFLLRKEFLQVFRNRAMLPILLVMPVVQLLILSFAATYELKEVGFTLIDRDQSAVSRQLVAKFQSTGYFTMREGTFDQAEAIESLNAGRVSMIMEFPNGFGKQLESGQTAPVQLIIDAVDGSSAGLIQSYSASIINDFNAGQIGKIRLAQTPTSLASFKHINLIPQNWYNPDLDYITFMVPGILVVLVSMIGLFLSGMNIVREQEMGTIEQLNVTPIHKYQFMVGKLLPFWIIGMADLLIGLTLARYGFHIPFLGSLFTILVIASIFMVVIQSMGLLISTLTQTQQQAMFIAWFFMVIFILMGGLFTPIESMPVWAQNLALVNPVAYFIKIMRMVLLKGAGWKEIASMATMLAIMGGALLLISINRYKKTTA